jgi:hypothetical protein
LGVFSSLSVVWLLLPYLAAIFCRAAFFVVANSHSNKSLIANRQSLSFPSWLILSRLIAAPTNRQRCRLTIRHSLPFNSPVAIRYSLPFSLVGQFAG